MTRKRIAAGALGLPSLGAALCFLLIGCGGGGGGGGGVVPPPGGKAKWTFLVYMNASNDLQPDAAPNVNDMEQVGSTADVNMVLQWTQTQCGVPSRCGNPTWNGTRRYFISKDSDPNTVNSKVVQDLGGNVDPGDWHTLHDFIAWGETNYPADHFALVLWDHGSGWRNIFRSPRTGPHAPRAVSFDYVRGSEIETWELPQALAATQTLDMVVFDASLLQQMEVDYEIRNSTPIVVGSEESPPGRGYIYNTFLADLVANPSMTPAQFGSQIVHRTIDQYASFDSDPGDLSILTESEIDTSKLQNLADKLNTFGSALDAHLADSAAIESTARKNAFHYAKAEDPGYWDYKDLFDYTDRIRTGGAPADLVQKATDVETALNACVMTEAHVSAENGSHGLTIDVPDPGAYVSTYSNLAFSRATTWSKWLQDQPP